MTARRRAALSFDEAEALAAERRAQAVRRAVSSIATHLPRDQLRVLIADIALVGEAPALLKGLRKRYAEKPPAQVGGAPNPSAAVWAAAAAKVTRS